MYRILKEKGNNSNVTLENVETKATIVLGRLSMDMISILSSNDGLSFGTGPDDIKLIDKWSFTVKDETAKLLSAKALSMHAPERYQKKETTKKKSTVDAMDVLLGLASYN